MTDPSAPDAVTADASTADGEPVLIPPDLLDPATLRRVAESFVLREGTDYGEQEVPFEAKVAEVLEQVHAGRAEILFDPATESVTLRARP